VRPSPNFLVRTGHTACTLSGRDVDRVKSTENVLEKEHVFAFKRGIGKQ